MARLTLARKIAAITLLVWKKGVRFDAEYLTETFQEIPGHPRTQHQPQPRFEKYLQGCRDPGRYRPRTVPGVSRRFNSQRDEADDGAPHLGAQDCGHHFIGLEERSPFRRRISETAISLSACGESIAGFISDDGPLGSADALIRG